MSSAGSMGSDGARAAVAVAQDLEGLRAMLAATPDAARLTEIGLGGVIIGPGASAQVGEIAAGLRQGDGDLVLLADRRPMAGPDGELKASVEAQLAAQAEALGPRTGGGAAVARIAWLGAGNAEVHADADTLSAAVAAVGEASVIVTVGSGTLTDIGKYVSARTGGTPHVVVQTAASVNGFADDQSVLIVDGVKRTTPTRWPDRLIVDTIAVGRAPVAMSQAGLGDLLATYTAPADWLLARFVGQDDSFSQTAVALTRDHIDAVVDTSGGLPAGDPEAIGALVAALTLSGISMGVAGRTAPGSGMEHTVSHLLEMTEAHGATLHGAKVGILSVFAAALWARVRAAIADGALTRLRFPDEQEMRQRVDVAFRDADPSGTMAAECWADYRKKLTTWNAAQPALADLAERWPTFEAEAGALLAPPERLLDALRRAGAPTRLSDLGIEADRAHWALANCHLQRNRFTIADLAFFLGLWNEDGVDALIGDVSALGGGL